ncbi:MAG: hypothetical protein QXU20_03410, partial [Candidatus Woesearchaeota archaeon]
MVKKFNKRGLEYYQIVGIILILVVLFIISFVLYNLKGIYSENQEIEQCRKSVEIAAAATYASYEVFSSQLK